MMPMRTADKQLGLQEVHAAQLIFGFHFAGAVGDHRLEGVAAKTRAAIVERERRSRSVRAPVEQTFLLRGCRPCSPSHILKERAAASVDDRPVRRGKNCAYRRDPVPELPSPART